MYRGEYGELRLSASDRADKTIAEVLRIMGELDGSRGGDEHGAWSTGAEFSRNGRGTAVNADLYGIARWKRQALGVVQVRRFERGRRFPRLNKAYFLIGRNERTRRAFAHPIEWRIVRMAISRGQCPVRAAMAWIWDIQVGDLDAIKRSGDVALVPCVRPPKRADTRIGGGTVRVVDAHLAAAAEFATDSSRLWARDARLSHEKQQHRSVSEQGWARVAIGQRDATSSFARATAD